MWTKGVLLLELIVCWTTVCNGEYETIYDYTIKDKFARELAKEELILARATVGEVCTNHADCENRLECDETLKTCKCATGTGGDGCETDAWCTDSGKFKDCQGENGTCKFDEDLREVTCKCDDSKEVHPTENRCRETCKIEKDCKNGGTCKTIEGKQFCSCKPGFFGDKCQIIFDCTTKGKYSGCTGTGVECIYNGKETVCNCPENQKYHDTEHKCKECTCGETKSHDGTCKFENNQKICNCSNGYAVKDGICTECTCGNTESHDGTCKYENGQKICNCIEGYAVKDGICTECDCGVPESHVGVCKFESGKKICKCNTGYAEKNGKCIVCSCGTNGTCSYEKGNKHCECHTGFALKDEVCKATCTTNEECKYEGTCDKNFCSCKPLLNGDKCEIVYECTIKFKGCKKSGGNCTYDIDDEKAVCMCPGEKKYHETADACKDTCSSDDECKNRGTCEDNFCSCKDGVIGDKCQTVADCTTDGKYRGCETSGGNCTHDGTKAVCTCPPNQKYHDTDHVCKECNCGSKGSCSYEKGKKMCDCDTGFKDKDGICTEYCEKNEDCEYNQKCGTKNGWKTCVCADGLIGDDCKKMPWCETGKFRYCKGGNGTCEYVKEERSVNCTCPSGKELQASAMGCRETCDNDNDCENEGKCVKKFCECNKGFYGDKCEIIFDCTEKGKYRGCVKSGGKCTFEGGKTVCNCPDDKGYQNKEHICKDTCEKDTDCNGGKCVKQEEKMVCICKEGFIGDKCEIVKECKIGIYSNCEDSGGECIFEKNAAKCICTDPKALDTEFKYCREKCEKKGDCQNGATCNADKVCKCKPNTSGDKCAKIDGCDGLKCDEKGAICIYDIEKETPTCKCTDDNYYFDEDKCKPEWCRDGCNTKVSTCEYNNGVGVCKCEIEGLYYDYTEKKCNKIDTCFNMTCGEGEICSDGKCTCAENYELKEKKCQKKNLCDNKNICFSGSECKSLEESNFGFVRCVCKSSQFYNPKSKQCEDASCFLPGKKADCKKSCPRADMERKEDGNCKPKLEVNICGKDCGSLGWCYNVSKIQQNCLCDPNYGEKDAKNEKCVLKKTVCPDSKKDGEDKCKCEKPYKRADNDITCELISCSDEEAKKECKKKGAEKCVDNWRNNKGYNCICPFGYYDDPEKGCIDPCSRDDMKTTCSLKGQVCYNGAKSNTGDCRCLPTFAFNDNTKKCDLASKNTFMINSLPVVSKKYEIGERNINQVELNIDVINSMTKAFKNLDYIYVYDFKVQEGVVLCDVWLQFQSSLPEKFKPSLEVQRWKSQTVAAGDTYLLPPALFLGKNFENATEEEATLCSTSVQQSLCGTGSDCSDDKCFCSSGFKEIESTIKDYGKKRVVRCEDIDECAEGSHNCTEDTSQCVNTVGDFACRCKPGYRKASGDVNALNHEECIGLCKFNPCGKGACKLNKNNNVDCTCPPGYSGSFCDRSDVYLAKASKATKVVGAVLGTMLAIVIVLIIFYFVRQRKNSYSEDFAPAPRVDNAEMIERRPMRGVTNRAYQ